MIGDGFMGWSFIMFIVELLEWEFGFVKGVIGGLDIGWKNFGFV